MLIDLKGVNMWTIDDLRKDLLELKRLLYEEKDLKKRVELCNYIERLELLICENTHSSKIKYDKEELFFNSLYNLPKYGSYLERTDTIPFNEKDEGPKLRELFYNDGMVRRIRYKRS